MALPAHAAGGEFRQDLEMLGQLVELDRSFSPADHARFEAERARALAAAATLTPQGLEMEVSRLVAIAGNGHTTVGRRLRRLARVPLRLAWFEEGLHVVRADASNADLLGARVESVNGLAPSVSGTAEHARGTAPIFIESPYALANLLADRAELPLVLREPDASLFVKRLDGGGVYIHIASVTDDERGDLENQLATLLAAVPPASLRFAVLDMRFDGGGNYFKTLDFTRGLPQRIAPDGRLFILTDNGTFSAALVTPA